MKIITQEILSVNEFRKLLQEQQVISNIAVQGLDLTSLASEFYQSTLHDCLFIGCGLTDPMTCYLQQNNYVFPKMDLPYLIYPNKLYNRFDLYKGYDPDNPDSYLKTYHKIIYDHFIKTGKYTTDIKESLARSLHDQSITNALQDFIQKYDERQIIAVMGGHSMLRTDPMYKKIVLLSKSLTEQGKLMISGGGPGAMEATHLGAWLAESPEDTVDQALEILAESPLYTDKNWLSAAFKVIDQYQESNYNSLGIPTWLYGHEPPSPFASHIAKYFTNSIREEGLLAIAKGGIIFTPGSAGTMQEVFQEVTQNHYLTLKYASPMLFMNTEFWTNDWGVYSLLKNLSDQKKLNNLDLGLYDSIDRIKDHLEQFYKSNTPA